MCLAKRHERNEGRKAYRSGSDERNLTTSAGTVKLKVPKLRGASFETQMIERYRRREASVDRLDGLNVSWNRQKIGSD